MKLEFSNQLGVNAETESVATARIVVALDRFQDRIRTVAIVARDQNGPRCGVDKSCRLTAHLIGGEAITVSEKDRDFVAAVTKAAERLARSITRALERQRNGKHSVSISGL